MTAAQLEARLSMVERLIAECRDSKSLPALNATYQKLIDRLVALDLAGKTKEKTR